MAVEVSEDNNHKMLTVHVTGKLTHEDYEQFVPAFERFVATHGKIRVLFEMIDFHGWTAGAIWDDIKFDLGHFSDIERLAMAGDKQWEKGMSVFCRPFTSATIRYFDRSAIDEAREWLNAD